MQYLTYTDPDTGLFIREGSRGGFAVKDIELTVTGFAGTEDVDWMNIDKVNIAYPNGTPSGLALTVISDTEIQLDWTAGSTNHDGHSIERSPDNATWSEIATVTGATVHYHNTGLTDATHYYYRVRAYKGTLYSSYSNTDDDYTDPTALASAWGRYDFVNAANLTKDGSNRVAQVTDLSGLGHHLLQSDDAKKPVHSTYCAFDGSNDFMSTGSVPSLNYPVTTYTVFVAPTAGYKTGVICDGYTNLAGMMQMNGAAATIASVFVYASLWIPAAGAAPINADQPTLITTVINGANSLLQVVKNTPHTNAGAANYADPNGFTVGSIGDGSSNWTKINWYGAIRFAAAHDAPTRLKVQDWLIRKYGVIYDTWILAGQSNASGQGAVANITGADYKVAIPNGYVYNYAISNKFEVYDPGVNSQNDAGKFGLENSLLKNLSDYKASKVYIVKYGLGSSALASNAGIDWAPDSVGECYSLLQTRLTGAYVDLGKTIYIPKIKGIIWVQGESDADNQTYANAYYTNLEHFMESHLIPYLKGLNTGYYFSHELIRILIECPTTWTYANTVRAAQVLYCTNYGAIYINTDGYTLIDANAHYNADALVAIGIDIYNNIKDL